MSALCHKRTCKEGRGYSITSSAGARSDGGTRELGAARRVQISASAGCATSEMALTPRSSAARYLGPAGNFTAEIGSETVGSLADRLETLLVQRCDGVRRLHRRVCRLVLCAKSGHARRKLMCAGRVISSAPRLSTAPELSNWAYPRSRSGFARGQTAFSRKPEGSRLAFRIPEFGQRGNGESRRAARTRH